MHDAAARYNDAQSAAAGLPACLPAWLDRECAYSKLLCDTLSLAFSSSS